MVTRVDCRKPNTYTYKREKARSVPPTMTHDRIKCRHEQVSSVQAWHGSENIGVFTIYAMKYVKSNKSVKTAEACHVARRVEHRSKAIVHRVPWWRGRMNIVSYESDNVDRKKSPSKA